MAQPIADRVKDATTTTGAGDITLTNVAPAGYVTFLAGFGSSTSKSVCYCVSDPATGDFEVGYGLYTSATNLLVRSRIVSNSAGTLVAISLGAGTKDVFCTPSSKSMLVQDNTTAGVIELDGNTTFQTATFTSGSVPSYIQILASQPTLTTSTTSTYIKIEAGASGTASTAVGGDLLLNAGASGNTGLGGSVAIRAGVSPAGRGGSINLYGGYGYNTTTTSCGDINLFGGVNNTATGAGGNIILASGEGGKGGSVTIIGGKSNQTSGTPGGNVVITGGDCFTGADAGSITLNTGTVSGGGFSGTFTVKLAGTTALTIAPTSTSSDVPKFGFFGATPVARPTGVAVTAAAIHAALVSLGLIAA